MNTSQINGTVIGNGSTDGRSFLTLATLGRALSSMALAAYRPLAFATTGRATSSIVMAGKVLLTMATTVRASAAFGLQRIGPKAFDPLAATGRATSAIALTATVPLVLTTTGQASSSIGIGGIKKVTLVTTGRATSTFALITTGYLAPPERTMSIPFENRTMVLR